MVPSPAERAHAPMCPCAAAWMRKGLHRPGCRPRNHTISNVQVVCPRRGEEMTGAAMYSRVMTVSPGPGVMLPITGVARAWHQMAAYGGMPGGSGALCHHTLSAVPTPACRRRPGPHPALNPPARRSGHATTQRLPPRMPAGVSRAIDWIAVRCSTPALPGMRGHILRPAGAQRARRQHTGGSPRPQRAAASSGRHRHSADHPPLLHGRRWLARRPRLVALPMGRRCDPHPPGGRRAGCPETGGIRSSAGVAMPCRSTSRPPGPADSPG